MITNASGHSYLSHDRVSSICALFRSPCVLMYLFYNSRKRKDNDNNKPVETVDNLEGHAELPEREQDSKEIGDLLMWNRMWRACVKMWCYTQCELWVSFPHCIYTLCPECSPHQRQLCTDLCTVGARYSFPNSYNLIPAFEKHQFPKFIHISTKPYTRVSKETGLIGCCGISDVQHVELGVPRHSGFSPLLHPAAAGQPELRTPMSCSWASC